MTPNFANEILKDRRKMDARDNISAAVRNVLESDDRIVFAYLFGSFVRGETFRDIDVAVYLRDPGHNPFEVSSSLKERLSRNLGGVDRELYADFFDVAILNGAPFTFLKRVFVEGTLLVDRDPDLRTDLIEYVSRKYRECAGLMVEASMV